MTDKLKKRVRALMEKSGMTYQAASNLLRAQLEKEVPPAPTDDVLVTPRSTSTSDLAAAPAAAPSRMDEILQMLKTLHASRQHEPDCPVSEWDDSAMPEPECECIRVDTSQLLFDGDDY